MTPEKIVGIVALIGMLVLVLSGSARRRGGIGTAKMLGWGVLVAGGIILAGLLLERMAK